jgi:hypothetical protein
MTWCPLAPAPTRPAPNCGLTSHRRIGRRFPGEAPRRGAGYPRYRTPGPVITAATALYAGVWVYAVFFPKGADGPSMFVTLTFGGGFVYLIILALCAGQMVALRREQRSGGQ